MMWHRSLGKIILVSIICVAVLYLIIPLDFMSKGELRSLPFIPHEDPATTEPVFSGIPSFVFDPDYLNLVLQMDPEKVKTMIGKRPLSRIAQSLKEVINNFIASRVYISDMIVEIDEDLSKLIAFMGQYRFDEATRLADKISAKLSQANRDLERVEETVESTGRALRVSLAPPGSDWRRSYDEMLESIRKGKEMLDLDKDILANFSKMLAGELPNLTKVTLNIEPMVAFVGDNISFRGVLTSEGKPLAGRAVDILVNGSQWVTVKTDASGYYQGRLQVPYWYIPELGLQAFYYPRDEDIGLQPFSLSPVRKLEVLFYQTDLEIALKEKAYPGLETTVTGRFDYGQSPPRKERNVEIYLDDVLIAEGMAQKAFSHKIRIDPEADVSEHIITISAAARGKYSPVVASVILNVIGVTPVLDLNIPNVAMIPGSVILEGKLYSEIGPLSEASIKMELGKSQVELISSEDGTFYTKIKTGMGFGVVGSQDLVIQVLPQEPWHAPLVTTRSVMMVNMVNSGAILAILIFLGIYLPSRLRERLGAYPRRRVKPEEAITWPELAPIYSGSVIIPTPIKETGQGSREPRNRVFYGYRLVVRLILGITKALLKPQQTLREFAKESGALLGPAAKYFIELTKIVERLLYSRYRPTEKDVGKSQQLSQTVEEELKGEGV